MSVGKVCPFNSSLKDTSVDEILVVSVGYFQFLIKGYEKSNQAIILFHNFQFLIKGYSNICKGEGMRKVGFQFLIKGYIKGAKGYDL